MPLTHSLLHWVCSWGISVIHQLQILKPSTLGRARQAASCYWVSDFWTSLHGFDIVLFLGLACPRLTGHCWKIPSSSASVGARMKTSAKPYCPYRSLNILVFLKSGLPGQKPLRHANHLCNHLDIGPESQVAHWIQMTYSWVFSPFSLCANSLSPYSRLWPFGKAAMKSASF